MINTNEIIAIEGSNIKDQKQEDVKRIEDRLCLAENMRKPLYKTCRQAPTVSRPAETPVKLNLRTALDMISASKVCYPKQAEEVNDNNLLHLRVDIMKLPQQSLKEDFKAQVRDDLPTDNKLLLILEDKLSKVNTLAYAVESDIMYDTKYSITEKGKVTMWDMTQPEKINKKIKQDSNEIRFSNLDGFEDRILAAIVDAFHKISENLLDADDQAIMLANDVFTIHKKGEEIERVEHNSAAVKIIALQAMLKKLQN